MEYFSAVVSGKSGASFNRDWRSKTSYLFFPRCRYFYLSAGTKNLSAKNLPLSVHVEKELPLVKRNAARAESDFQRSHMVSGKTWNSLSAGRLRENETETERRYPKSKCHPFTGNASSVYNFRKKNCRAEKAKKSKNIFNFIGRVSCFKR